MGLYPGARKQNQIGAGFIVTQNGAPEASGLI